MKPQVKAILKTLQIKFEVKKKEDKILQLEYEKDINKSRATEEHQQKSFGALALLSRLF
ncbi:hypothetical protein ACOBV8_21070 (plasmid) [Pseudoalteromonas espejiana]